MTKILSRTEIAENETFYMTMILMGMANGSNLTPFWSELMALMKIHKFCNICFSYCTINDIFVTMLIVCFQKF